MRTLGGLAAEEPTQRGTHRASDNGGGTPDHGERHHNINDEVSERPVRTGLRATCD
jgi:hypothetical protein